MLATRIYRFVLLKLRDEDLARTAVTDTFFEVWRQAERFRGESLVTTWMMGIAKFKALSLLRGLDQAHDDIEDYAEVIATDEENGEQRLERWQEERKVGDCMTRLSSAHRECLQLVYFEGLGLSDVARIQAVPENTVKTRLFHARKNMRQCVEGHAMAAPEA